jgi:hypothetical protein
MKYGYFSLNCNVIFLAFNAKVLCGPAYASGNFGDVLLFQFNKDQGYAMKNIKTKRYCASAIESALKEVFFAKVMSGLRTGPKFKKILSYDAVVYEDCVQFCMEICETGINN